MVGTIFEDSHIPISKWRLALDLLASSKKGISAHRLHRNLGISYKGPWFMAMRLRYAMANGGPMSALMQRRSGRGVHRRTAEGTEARFGRPPTATRRRLSRFLNVARPLLR
jgi:hypothetical protein